MATKRAVGVVAWQCDHCLDLFPTEKECRAHEKKHTGAFGYFCAGCGKHYSSKVKKCMNCGSFTIIDTAKV